MAGASRTGFVKSHALKIQVRRLEAVVSTQSTGREFCGTIFSSPDMEKRKREEDASTEQQLQSKRRKQQATELNNFLEKASHEVLKKVVSKFVSQSDSGELFISLLKDEVGTSCYIVQCVQLT
eukprot:TRINITY_DN537_c0_g1_i7.p1 TRINITY_DN537_c0_g1~~TRINITY_DN537_c0_g1_i7.p1  ORF type:complete len:123 (-),score=34.65 TRINITY_DN537_c0_g1_i7:961-1329(-)